MEAIQTIQFRVKQRAVGTAKLLLDGANKSVCLFYPLFSGSDRGGDFRSHRQGFYLGDRRLDSRRSCHRSRFFSVRHRDLFQFAID